MSRSSTDILHALQAALDWAAYHARRGEFPQAVSRLDGLEHVLAEARARLAYEQRCKTQVLSNMGNLSDA